MSSLYKIKEHMHDYTDTEKKIAEYILNNKDLVINYSSQKLADEVGASAAAIVRFSKRLGFKGFTHLKVEIAKDNSDVEDLTIDQLIESEDSMQSLIQKVQYANIKTIENTYRLLQPYLLEQCIAEIVSAKKVYLVGVGGSQIVVDDMFQKFSRINKEVISNQNFHVFLGQLNHITPEDLLIAYSYSGETREVIYSVKVAQERGAKTIGISQSGRNELSKISDLSISIPKEEQNLRFGSIASRYSMHAVSDLLYIGVAKEDMNETRTRLVSTLSTVRGLAKFDK